MGFGQITWGGGNVSNLLRLEVESETSGTECFFVLSGAPTTPLDDAVASGTGIEAFNDFTQTVSEISAIETGPYRPDVLMPWSTLSVDAATENDSFDVGFNDTFREFDLGIGNDNVGATAGGLNDFNARLTLNGGAGNDTLSASSGGALNGDAGDDNLAGSVGADSISGGDGDDNLGGGLGDDAMAGDAGNDTLVGGQGNDTVDGGAGDDVVAGVAGADTFIYNAFADGDVDVVTDFEEGVDSFRMTGVENAPGTGLQGRLEALNIADVGGAAHIS